MDEFDDRLRLQKFIYLLQTFDIYLGYDFSWYIRGPYCSTLSTCGFALREIYDKIPTKKIRFEDPAAQKKFMRFQDFIKGHESDVRFLEIAASLHSISATEGLENRDVVQELMGRKPGRFTLEMCMAVQKELKKWQLL
jgi:uncharacterized protein YwgA